MTVTSTKSNVLTAMTFLRLPLFNIDYEMNAKIFNQEGDLKYEYNPFRNLQLNTGELTDFRTTSLGLNLANPVDITVQPSYDGSVNLILNDDKNPPRLINSRFTVREDKRFNIIDRKGNNDVNIYKEDFVAQTTRLFKTSEKIPFVEFKGLYEGGDLKSGNHVFYFKYCDADGNESDIITESGIVSSYIGKLNDPFSIRGGLGNESANKICKFRLHNIETSYDFINIYYSRSTGEYTKEEITEVFRIINKKEITGTTMDITITGLEQVIPISVDELNIQYNIVDKVKTQAQIQNMLFFGNVDKPTIPTKELADLALRFYPSITNDNNIGYLDQNYQPKDINDELKKYEYYDASNVYEYTGYWNKEMYRLGIVFIMKDDSLSPVFNTRGKNGVGFIDVGSDFNNSISGHYTTKPLYDIDGKRQYIEYDTDGFINDSSISLENAYGVIRILYNNPIIKEADDDSGILPLSITYNVATETLDELKKYTKGYFFVRQKRIPTILAQGITIGVDKSSHLPSIRAKAINSSGQLTEGYIMESFMNTQNQLVHDFNSRLRIDKDDNVNTGGLICPEAQLRTEYFNEVFNMALFPISPAQFTPTDRFFTQSSDNRHFFIPRYDNRGASELLIRDIKLTLVEDNIPSRYSGTTQYSSRAGIPEEAWRTASFANQDKSATANNLIRGAFNTFVGMEGYVGQTQIIDIHSPGYDIANLRDYFMNQGEAFYPFYSMSNRYDLQLVNDPLNPYKTMVTRPNSVSFREYRGDCFINTFTTRIHRNFQDPEVPINDIIIDAFTWKTNYDGYGASGSLNKDNIVKINRADVNAVRIGHWATFKICSNINMAYRSVDGSHSSEFEITGKARSFYPLSSMSPGPESKIPESTVINVGFNSTTSEKVYIGLPDVPYIKNIFDNRIMFSDVHINDAFRNGYRVFQGLDYKDVTKQYGAIVKMFDWKGDLMIVFENGVGMMRINERALGGDGQFVFIKGAGVLSDTIGVLSDKFGSSWKDSIIRTTNYVYGIDTTAKKIWRTDGQTFEVISDFKIQKFLNDNITLDETEKYPLIALRNVKSHYNAFKDDVMFTFYDTTRNNEETEWNLNYNEQLNKWTTRYTWTPVSSDSINNVYFSFDKQSAKKMALIGYTLNDSETAQGVTLTDVNIKQNAYSLVGQLKLKGKQYYDRYTHVFSLPTGIQDNDLFEIVGDNLYFRGTGSEYTKFSFNLKVRVGLKLHPTDVNEIQFFFDFISTKVLRSSLNNTQRIAYDEEFSTYFWKHGQAGIFDISTPILPTMWYDRQEVFEYEFIVSDGPAFHKIYNNLYIISNNAEPYSFEYEVVGDAYEIDKNNPALSTGDVGNQSADRWTNVTPTAITTHQKGKDLKKLGRLKGNMQYLEDSWRVEIKPHRFNEGKIAETRIRDKYCKIRVRYSGQKLALITALQTLYIISNA